MNKLLMRGNMLVTEHGLKRLHFSGHRPRPCNGRGHSPVMNHPPE